MKQLLLIICSFLLIVEGFSQSLYVKGIIKDAETGILLRDVNVIANAINTSVSDKNGQYIIKIKKESPSQLTFFLLGYASITKLLNNETNDTVLLDVKLFLKPYELPLTYANAARKVDTVFGTWKFSIADFEFYNEYLLLLTFKKNMKQAGLVLADYSQHVLIEKQLDFEAKELTKDYLGNIIVVGEHENYFVSATTHTIYLNKLSKNDFETTLKPLIDKQDEKIYFSNYAAHYPEFTYYSYCSIDSTAKPIRKIVNEKLLHEYNMEFYFLKPRERTYARKISEEYKIDKHIVAATMSGLTSSIFYEPLYDPLFLIHDTICIFNHCNNVLLKYDKNLQLIDSIKIVYHHPKKWREWKNKLIVDELNEKVYALYQKNGFYYLKQINIYSGKIMASFKLTNQYVEGIKIKGDEVYYIYRPFESMQEQFLYKELIF